MVFSSHIFIFYFLPTFLFIYYPLPFEWKGLYAKNTFITIMSYVFYGWLVPWFVALMLALRPGTIFAERSSPSRSSPMETEGGSHLRNCR